ncbi:MAG: PKD domain-containing protein, partial [Bacteroidia bacterium]|nr:PKD domain-containing protein [Bacteroidia bacterium]
IQTVNLPPAVGGYQLVYQRCCRNQTIANIVAPLNTGATYNALIPGPPYVSNGNPVFNNWPPTFICVNAPFTFDHSATDFEGDSLVYELCDPLDGASPGFPMPQPPNPPPYIPVTWQPPYGPANLFGGVPLTINPQTGLLSCTPNAQGQYVYGVCVKEYRNGVYLSSTRRDYQINVVNCPQIVVSSIQSPTLVCGLLTASFTNNSFGAASFFWDFGDLLNINDTSSQQNPVFTYSDTGHYSAMLVAYSGINPACNDTSYGDVYVYPPLHAGFSYQNVPCTNTVMFNDTTHSLSGTLNYWHWDFGDNTISLQQNPTHVYNSGGNYTVTLIVGTNAGCSDTVSAVIPAIIVQPTASFSLSQVPCSG